VDGGGEGCPQCREHMECSDPSHGRYYVGKPGYGWRTNRCLRDWVRDDPIGLLAEEAHMWARMEGGVFPVWAGMDPPALLMEALTIYACEDGARMREENKPVPKAGGSAVEDAKFGGPRDPNR
jgi:hypothetical protein